MLLRYRWRIYWLFVASLVLIRCQHEEGPVSVSIALEEQALEVPAEAGTVQVGVSVVGAAWSAAVVGDAAWIANLERSATEDALIIHYVAHTGAKARSVRIRVLAGAAETELLLNQSAMPIQLSDERLRVGAATDSREVTVLAPEGWTAEHNIPWLSAWKIDANTLRISYASNAAPERIAELMVRAGDQAVVLEVVQDAVSLILEKDELAVSAVSGMASVRVTAVGAAWVASVVGETAWVTHLGKDTAEGLLHISYAAHTGAATRHARVRISAGSEVAELLLRQSTIAIALGEHTFQVGAAAGSEEVPVMAPQGWVAESELSWVEVFKVDANTLRLSYEANATAQRSGMITVAAGDQMATLKVMQDAVSLALEKTELMVGAEAGVARVGVTSVGAAWSASVTGDAGWITHLDKSAEGDLLSITYRA